MAFYSLPLFLLSLSLSLTPLQIQARESRQFFSKTTRFDPSKESTRFAEEEEPFKTASYNRGTELSGGNRNANDEGPSMFSNEEFDKYETKIPNYPNFDKQHGMSDTRFLENGKYFYDVNAERYGRGPYEPNGGRLYGNYGNGQGYEYGGDVRGYENGRENYEGQEEYVP